MLIFVIFWHLQARTFSHLLVSNPFAVARKIVNVVKFFCCLFSNLLHWLPNCTRFDVCKNFFGRFMVRFLNINSQFDTIFSKNDFLNFDRCFCNTQWLGNCPTNFFTFFWKKVEFFCGGECACELYSWTKFQILIICVSFKYLQCGGGNKHIVRLSTSATRMEIEEDASAANAIGSMLEFDLDSMKHIWMMNWGIFWQNKNPTRAGKK